MIARNTKYSGFRLFFFCFIVVALTFTITQHLAASEEHLHQDQAARLQHQPPVSQLKALGRQLFFDTSLSASQHLSCASCHSPRFAYGPSNNLDVQLGGIHDNEPGHRAAPSLRYLQNITPFSEHFYELDNNDSEDAGPTGGLMWDGRTNSLHEQAQLPLFAKNEMANHSVASLIARLAAGPSAPLFKRLFGDSIFSQADEAFYWLCMSLEIFQQSPEDFYPYSSRFDDYLRGKTRLTSQELHGLTLFNDPEKGNCAQCHPSQGSSPGAHPQFTDFGYIALGVPRNPRLKHNETPAYFDLGLCGPERTDLKNHAEYCGLFRTPTLRNSALKKTFFHNGVFHSLEDVIRFYMTRDSHPAQWYAATATNNPPSFDDSPTIYQDNIFRDAPFNRFKRHPSLSESDIHDMILFLHTLTDADLLAESAHSSP